MKRRAFIALLGGTAAWPLVARPHVARAQQAPLPVIGLLGISSRDTFASRLTAFHKGLGETGYVEHRNVAIDYRWADDQPDRLPALAADLIQRRVAVIATTGGTASALAAQAATSTVPIVFATAADPVDLGLVASFNRPGGNLTGVSFLISTVAPKQFEALHETVPNAGTIGVLVNPTNANAKFEIARVQAAADAVGRKLHIVHAANGSDLETAFATLLQQRVGAFMVAPDVFFFGQRNHIVSWAARHGVPGIYPSREFPEAGGLMSYGTSVDDAYRQEGVYVGRILKGEKPADLPVQQVVKVELVINLKTAKVIGVTIPLPLSGRADEVIE